MTAAAWRRTIRGDRVELGEVACAVADFRSMTAVVARTPMRRDPRVALSLAPADNPYEPVIVRGRVVEWLAGDAAWEIIDEISAKYIGAPYPREEERVVAVIEPERQTIGRG